MKKQKDIRRAFIEKLLLIIKKFYQLVGEKEEEIKQLKKKLNKTT